MAQPDKYSAGLGVILLPVGAGECSLCVTAVPGGMDPGWPAGRGAPGSSPPSPRPRRYLVVPASPPAEGAPVLFAALASAPANTSTTGARVPASATRCTRP